MGPRHGLVVLICCLLPGLAAALLPPGEIGDRGVLAAGTLAAGVLLFALGSWRHGRRRAPATAVLIAGAVVLRLLVWAGPVRLDDDLWRYLWDGLATESGVSPYRFAPRDVLDFDPELDPVILGQETAAELEVLAARASDPAVAEVLERINFPHLPTIYPPASQVAFLSAAVLAPASERLWRAGTVLADLAVVLLLIRVLAGLGRPTWWAAGYAWHPLPAIEFGAGGHQDCLGIAFLLLAVLALVHLRRVAAGMALAAAGGIKLFPWILALAWGRRLGLGGLAALAVSVLVLAVPFALLGPPDPAGLSAYVRGWEYFSGPYAVLGAVAGFLGLDAGLPGEAMGGRLLLLVLLTLVAGATWRRWGELGRGTFWLELLLVFSPVVDPWYVPWGLAVGVLRGSIAWPVFAMLIPASYFGYAAEGHAWELRLVVWGPFLVLWMREWYAAARWRRRPDAMGRQADLEPR